MALFEDCETNCVFSHVLSKVAIFGGTDQFQSHPDIIFFNISLWISPIQFIILFNMNPIQSYAWMCMLLQKQQIYNFSDTIHIFIVLPTTLWIQVPS